MKRSFTFLWTLMNYFKWCSMKKIGILYHVREFPSDLILLRNTKETNVESHEAPFCACIQVGAGGRFFLLNLLRDASVSWCQRLSFPLCLWLSAITSCWFVLQGCLVGTWVPMWNILSLNRKFIPFIFIMKDTACGFLSILVLHFVFILPSFFPLCSKG